jgi:hypothetical protein
MRDLLETFRPEHSNRCIVDLLGALRAHKKEVEALEAQLKDDVAQAMGERDSLPGDEFIARQTVSERKGGWDGKKLEAELGMRAASFRKPPTTVYTITTELRAEARAA